MMTFAPPTIRAVRALLKGQDADLDDAELGIVGGPSHVLTGTSYHLGADQLIMSKNPYSARTARDKAGLSNAASALDVDDDLDELRALSVWCVEECRKGAPDTLDLREIIYSPDGVQVLQWDRERGMSSPPQPHSDLSHRKHTHYSWYRDSEFRDKTALFKRFFEGGGDVANEDRFLPNVDQYEWEKIREQDPVKGIELEDGSHVSLPNLPLRRAIRIESKIDALKVPQPAPVDPAVIEAAVRAALADPTVLAGIANAVNDNAHKRLAG